VTEALRQFDVVRNSRPLGVAPYLVVLQSEFSFATAERIVAPLVRPDAGQVFAGRIAPLVEVDDEPLAALLSRMTSVPARALGKPIATVAQHSAAIIEGIDFWFVGV
jgi:hypothetical protein